MKNDENTRNASKDTFVILMYIVYSIVILFPLVCFITLKFLNYFTFSFLY